MIDVDDMAAANKKEGDNNDNNDDEGLDPQQREINKLKAILAERDNEIVDLKRGLDAQVSMVMELENLEQKEHQAYEKRLEANKTLIHELGERVGSESKGKAELESILTYTQKQCEDQMTQIDRLNEMNKVNTELLAALKKDDGQPNPAKWEIHSKLEYMMETNQKLILELAESQEVLQRARKDVSDNECLCLELSSQLDKLASQLNEADELMANVKTNLQEKESELKKCQERVTFLEKALVENDNESDDDTKGTALLLKQLKLKDAQTEQMKKERDASLSKATKFSLALASTREQNDILLEKIESAQSSYSFFNKSPNAATPVIVASSSSMASPSAPKVVSNNSKNPASAAALATPKLGTPRRQLSGDGSSAAGVFDGSRIRNFFGRAKSPSIDNTTTTTKNNDTATEYAPSSTQGNLAKSRLFNRNPSANNSQASNNGNSKNNNGKQNGDQDDKDEGNPFDDDLNASFANPSVGKESSMDENVQGGGGDVNLALTL